MICAICEQDMSDICEECHKLESKALDQIAELMDAAEWDSGTLAAIADIVRGTGRTIREPNSEDSP